MALPKNPLTRIETYLSNIAGENTTLPDHPITRIEQYLEYIAQNGGGGGGGGTITMDDEPTQGSNNPVRSGGLYTILSQYEIATLSEAKTYLGLE